MTDAARDAEKFAGKFENEMRFLLSQTKLPLVNDSSNVLSLRRRVSAFTGHCVKLSVTRALGAATCLIFTTPPL